jgi:hypothetical protein
MSSTLLRAWRVVCRARGRPWADGKDATRGPIASTLTHSTDPESSPIEFEDVYSNGWKRGLVRRHIGHHRGEVLFAFLVELHVTSDIVATPPGGRCDVLVNPADKGLKRRARARTQR